MAELRPGGQSHHDNAPDQPPGVDGVKGDVMEAEPSGPKPAGHETGRLLSMEEATTTASSPQKTPQAKDGPEYFSPPDVPISSIHRVSPSLVSLSSASKESSPLSSAHSSSVSILGAAHSTRSSPGNATPTDLLKDRQGTRELAGPATIGTNGTTTTAALTSAPGQARSTSQDNLSAIEAYQGYPVYPNQAFAALHSQIHPTFSHRPRSSQRPPNVFGSNPAMASQVYREYSPSENSSRTVGNTPVSSPSLYTPSGQTLALDHYQYDDTVSHTSPYLTWTQSREPKE